MEKRTTMRQREWPSSRATISERDAISALDKRERSELKEAADLAKSARSWSRSIVRSISEML